MILWLNLLFIDLTKFEQELQFFCTHTSLPSWSSRLFSLSRMCYHPAPHLCLQFIRRTRRTSVFVHYAFQHPRDRFPIWATELRIPLLSRASAVRSEPRRRPARDVMSTSTLLKSSMKSYSQWDRCLEGTCSGEVALTCGSFLLNILGVGIRKSNISNLLLSVWSFEIKSSLSR
jgi:hypothetical protein